MSAACRTVLVGASGNEWPETLEEKEIYNEGERSGETDSGKPEALWEARGRLIQKDTLPFLFLKEHLLLR